MTLIMTELNGFQLDYAVAVCEGIQVTGDPRFSLSYEKIDHDGRPYFTHWEPSSNWAQGGPIIERERIAIKPLPFGKTLAYKNPCGGKYQQGFPYCDKSMLVAAMRCYVASKLGDSIEIPDKYILYEAGAQITEREN